MKLRYAFRFYPTAAQTRVLARVFGACRYIYNWGLRLRTDAYRQEDYSLSYGETSALLTRLKRTPEHAWLQEISGVPTQQALRHLQTAFANFFEKRAKHPSFKKKAGHQAVGIDLGITALATLSTGEKFRNPRPLDRFGRQPAHARRDLAGKKKGSKRRGVQRLKVARLHARIADARTDYLHKTTTDLVRRFDVIATEDLNVRGMGKNHALARALSDAAFGLFRRMLEYKCKWYGRELRRVERFYPSGKRCFDCGHVLEELPLDCREWTCPQCGHQQDRDLNAAKNILAAGQAVTARGGKVRPKRDGIRKGASLRSANQPESLHKAS